MLRCNVRDWSLSSRMSLTPTPLSPSTLLAAARPQGAVIVVVTQQNFETKKTALPSFIRPFLCLAISFLWPCGVDFNRE